MSAHPIIDFPPEGASPVYELSADEVEALAQCAGQFEDLDVAEQTEWYCRSARRAARGLPGPLRDFLEDFGDRGSRSGFVVLRGADVGPVPPTPPDNTRAIGRHTLLAREAAVALAAIAQQVAYQAEAQGAPQQDMVPNRNRQFAPESQGSRCELEAHTEQCFSELRPDVICLACLRGDPHAATHALSARQLVSHLSPDEVADLRRPLWTTLYDPSFKPYVPDPHQMRGPFPILTGSQDDPFLRADRDLMHGITQAAHHLLRKVIDTYQQHRTSHVLQRGDILLLDNRRAMHGRSAFQPRYDGGDRFVVRSTAVRDLHPSTHARRGRLVLAEFS